MGNIKRSTTIRDRHRALIARRFARVRDEPGVVTSRPWGRTFGTFHEEFAQFGEAESELK